MTDIEDIKYYINMLTSSFFRNLKEAIRYKKGTEDYNEFDKEKILKDAIETLGVEYVLFEMFFDIKLRYERLVNDFLEILNKQNSESAKEVKRAIINEADNIRIILYDEKERRHKVIKLVDYRKLTGEKYES